MSDDSSNIDNIKLTIDHDVYSLNQVIVCTFVKPQDGTQYWINIVKQSDAIAASNNNNKLVVSKIIDTIQSITEIQNDSNNSTIVTVNVKWDYLLFGEQRDVDLMNDMATNNSTTITLYDWDNFGEFVVVLLSTKTPYEVLDVSFPFQVRQSLDTTDIILSKMICRPGEQINISLTNTIDRTLYSTYEYDYMRIYSVPFSYKDDLLKFNYATTVDSFYVTSTSSSSSSLPNNKNSTVVTTISSQQPGLYQVVLFSRFAGIVIGVSDVFEVLSKNQDTTVGPITDTKITVNLTLPKYTFVSGELIQRTTTVTITGTNVPISYYRISVTRVNINPLVEVVVDSSKGFFASDILAPGQYQFSVFSRITNELVYHISNSMFEIVYSPCHVTMDKLVYTDDDVYLLSPTLSSTNNNTTLIGGKHNVYIYDASTVGDYKCTFTIGEADKNTSLALNRTLFDTCQNFGTGNVTLVVGSGWCQSELFQVNQGTSRSIFKPHYSSSKSSSGSASSSSQTESESVSISMIRGTSKTEVGVRSIIHPPMPDPGSPSQ